MELPSKIDQPRTWVLDLDGTLVAHNGHKGGGDSLLPGVAEFFSALPPEDVVILLTAREEEHRDSSLRFLASNGIRVDHCVFGLPKGLRVLVNDRKPDGEATAFCLNLDRDGGLPK